VLLDIIGGWFVPGLGYFRRRRYVRAFILFIVIEGTFFIGLCLKGSVVPPIFDASGGGIISMLSFIIQLGNGLVSMASLTGVLWAKRLLTAHMTPGPLIIFLAGKQTHAMYELGGFYLLVSGAMNYFVVTNFYDRYRAGRDGRSIEHHSPPPEASSRRRMEQGGKG